MCVHLIEERNCSVKVNGDGKIRAEINKCFKEAYNNSKGDKTSVLGVACGVHNCCFTNNKYVELTDCTKHELIKIKKFE